MCLGLLRMWWIGRKKKKQQKAHMHDSSLRFIWNCIWNNDWVYDCSNSSSLPEATECDSEIITIREQNCLRGVSREIRPQKCSMNHEDSRIARLGERRPRPPQIENINSPLSPPLTVYQCIASMHQFNIQLTRKSIKKNVIEFDPKPKSGASEREQAR